MTIDELTPAQIARIEHVAPLLFDALRTLVCADNGNCWRDTMRYLGMFDAGRAALTAATGESYAHPDAGRTCDPLLAALTAIAEAGDDVAAIDLQMIARHVLADPTGKPGADELLIIAQYTRAQALADGALIDVSAMAREAGIVYPAAISQALSADIDAIPAHLVGLASREGRLWDVLWMARCAMRDAPIDAERIAYELILPVGPEAATGFETTYAVQLVCGPGDDAEPVLTLMRTDED